MREGHAKSDAKKRREMSRSSGGRRNECATCIPELDRDEFEEDNLLSKLSVVSLTSFSYFQSVCNEAYADEYANSDWQMGVPTEEATPLQNLFGFLFTAFCGWYFWRLGPGPSKIILFDDLFCVCVCCFDYIVDPLLPSSRRPGGQANFEKS